MPMFRLFVDSSTGVDIDPEYDYKEQDFKVEDKHRTRSGREYRYKWGDVEKITMGMRFVNSSTMSQINDWWKDNTDLLWMEVGGSSVSSFHLSNKSKPIDKRIKPYTDQFAGKIELESY